MWPNVRVNAPTYRDRVKRIGRHYVAFVAWPSTVRGVPKAPDTNDTDLGYRAWPFLADLLPVIFSLGRTLFSSSRVAQTRATVGRTFRFLVAPASSSQEQVSRADFVGSEHQSLLEDRLPDTSWRPIVASFGYTIGFLIVILGRMQLFTESTLSATIPVATKPTRLNLLRLARLWSIVFGANMLGTFLS